MTALRRQNRICLAILLTILTSADWSEADLITFAFEAESLADSGPSYPFLAGQTVSGFYTFDTDTVPLVFGGANTFTTYIAAVTDFSVTIDGFGTGTGGPGGTIRLGDPVMTTGSFNFLSDQYSVSSAVSGINFFDPFFGGVRNLISANIRLQDLDLQGLDSEVLSATPPDLSFFLDNTGPNFDADHADIFLSFDTPSSGFNSAGFQLTSLTAITAVPEPSSVLVIGACALGFIAMRRRRQHQAAA